MSGLITYNFLVPPVLLVLVSALAAWLTLWNPRLGISIGIVATSLLYLASLPAVSARMIEDVEVTPPSPPDFSAAQAIVVLGGGVHRGNGTTVPDTLGRYTLERLYFAAHAYRQLKLRMAVTGGRPPDAHSAEAVLMKAALEDDFAVPVTWVESQSRTTYENALYTKKLLQAENVTTVVLVTNPWHMRRALWSFERAGIDAIPWPAPATYEETNRIDDFLPSMRALQSSYHALHEAIGLAYYQLRY